MSGEERVEVGRLRSGPHAVDPLVADPRLDRADEAGPAAERHEGGVHEVGGRRLAVGAGDPDEAQRELLGAVDPRGDGAEHGPGRLDDDDGQVEAGRGDLLGAGRVGEDGHGPGAHDLVDEVGTVGPGPREGGVEVTREDGAGVERHARDVGLEDGHARPDEHRELTDRGAVGLRRSGGWHVDRPYRGTRLVPLRRRVGSASATLGSTLRVTGVAFLPVGGIFSSWRAYVVTSLNTGPAT